MSKNKNMKNKQQEPLTTRRVISKEDAAKGRYPNSTVPGVHSDSAPIGGG